MNREPDLPLLPEKILDWVDECGLEARDEWCSVAELYAAFVVWVGARKIPCSPTAFGRALKHHGLKPMTVRNRRGYLGLRLPEPDSVPPEVAELAGTTIMDKI